MTTIFGTNEDVATGTGAVSFSFSSSSVASATGPGTPKYSWSTMSSTIPTIFPTWASLTSSSFSVTAVATASTVDTETPASSARPKFFWMASSRASSCSPSFSAAEDSWLMKSTEGRPLINESSRATNCSVMRSGAAFGCFSRSATASSGRVAVAMESNCPEVLSGTDERLVKGTRSAAAQESAEKRTQSLMSDVEKRRENAAQKKTCSQIRSWQL
mmetsp:Transcript_1970/g.8703  ORF Transcript_1970/g.8703 Transcript_1970/m.8703 type:complete len:216 (-) Transcript_1970:110-757(-)